MEARSKVAIVLTGLIIAQILGGAQAQTSAPAAATQKLKAKPDSGETIAVTVTNKRRSGVTELDVALAGSAAFRPLLRKLAPGKQSVVTLPRDESCTFDFYIKYEDGQTNTVTGVDVCPDGKLNLVE
jgi:FlaG/FlaF family flagellin (archaellin)